MRFWHRWDAWLDTSEAPVARWLRAARSALLGEMPVLAGGTALFAMFAVVPLLSAAAAVYGLVADPHGIEGDLRKLGAVLPQQVAGFLADQLARHADSSARELGVALAVSIAVALFSARGSARALVDSLNRAYRVRERRSPVDKLLVTLAMAAGTLLGLMLMLVAVVALPAVFALAGLAHYAVVEWLRWPALMSVIYATLLLLYRYGPSPRDLGTVRHLWPGAAIATTLLVLVSLGLSLWVDRFAAYDLWYGTFGSIVIVLLWFYLSVLALVLGGFVNAELERHAGAPDPDRSMY